MDPGDAHEFGFRDRALYASNSDTLVIADLHLGRELAANIEFPLRTNANMIDRIRDLLDHFTPQSVVLAGDVLHSFSSLPSHIRAAIDDLRELITRSNASLIVVEGNHDTMLETIPHIQCVSEYSLCGESTVVCHGHQPPERSATRYVMGHDHPTIVIEGHRRPCFLYGRRAYNGSDVVVLPAFNRLTPGVPINNRRSTETVSPLIADLAPFRPIVYDETTDEPLVFPPLSEFEAFL